MKCIVAIKPTKQTEVGTVKRIDDIGAESMVKSGYWKYIPKSQFKKVIIPESVNDQITESVTTTKKSKKPSKK
jgi:hypothetical protein